MSEMSGVEVDFTNTSDNGSLEDGEYEGVVTELVTTVRNDKVSAYFNIKINGRTYKSRFYPLQENALGFLKGALKNLGVDIGKEKVKLNELPVRGRKAIFKASKEEYNGKTFTRINPVKYLGQLSEEEMIALEGAPF